LFWRNDINNFCISIGVLSLNRKYPPPAPPPKGGTKIGAFVSATQELGVGATPFCGCVTCPKPRKEILKNRNKKIFIVANYKCGCENKEFLVSS